MDEKSEVYRPAYHEYDSRLAAYVLLLRKNDAGEEELLLALWNQYGNKLWTVPGGGVELDETPAVAAVRELFEESGYKVELTGLLAVDTTSFRRRRRTVPPSSSRDPHHLQRPHRRR